MRYRRHFESSSELARFYLNLRETGHRTHHTDMSSRKHANNDVLLGKVGAEELLSNTFDDVGEATRQIEKLADTIWESVPSLQRVWSLQLAGAFPCVPAYLSGQPESMWGIEHELSDRTPIRIWIGLNSTWSITPEEILQRGAAVTALALALSKIRPVYLTPYIGWGNNLRDTYSGPYPSEEQSADFFVSWDISASPIVISEVATSLCNFHVTRNLSRDFVNFAQPLVPLMCPWPDGWTQSRGGNEAKYRESLGAAPDDLWLDQMHNHTSLWGHPIEWIQDKLKKYAQSEDE